MDIVRAVGIHLDVILLILLKARLVNRYGVCVGNQMVHAELAASVGVYRHRSSFGGIGDHNRRIRDQRTSGVGDCSVDRSVNCLSECATG